MQLAMRKWTQKECDLLFDAYFGPFPGLCPVCAQEVCIIMSYLGRFVTLSLSCEGCRNKATVSRALPLHQSPRAFRRTDEDESKWG